MANEISGLFGKYSSTYATGQGEGVCEVMDAKGQRKTSRYELRGFHNDVPRISKRGGNFLDRVVCWLEDRVFSLTRSGESPSLRQKSSNQFASDVGEALREIDPALDADGKDVWKHDLVRRIESVRVRDLPLRSGFVRGILQEVATLAGKQNHGDELPELARNAFSVQDEEPRQREVQIQPVADSVGGVFSFANLDRDQFIERLSKPVQSKIVVPKLRELDFLGDRDGANEKKSKFIWRVSRMVAYRIIVAEKGRGSGSASAQRASDKELNLLRISAGSEDDQVPDEQLQAMALESVVEQHQKSGGSGGGDSLKLTVEMNLEKYLKEEREAGDPPGVENV